MVICDRYFDSTTAYQGFGRGIDMSAISYLNSFAIEGIIPDLTIFLDVDTEIGLKRATMLSNNSELRFEDEFLKKKEVNGKLFLARVRDGYCQIARQYPERIKIIDANQDISMVIKDIIEIINPKLAQKFKKEFSLEL